jgi:peptide/nickel transport system substrate-binding protein
VRRWGTAVLSVVIGATALTPSARVAPLQEPARGGTLRIGVFDSFGFTNQFDPTGEYLGFAWGIYSNLLLRTLLTYRHVEGPAGAEVVADLATEVPVPTDDGKTYTFRLKEGIRFGPPLDRPITSHDVEYAFERLATRELAAQYRFYYDPLIEGMHDFRRGRSDDISGIETPDDDTIVFHLTRPAGDFVHRVAMPATAPIPEEVARCSKSAGDYGRVVIASGPYMIEGSEDLVVDQGCREMRHIAGFRPDRSLSLVRNPSYDPATDSPEVRESFVDAVRFRIFRERGAMFRRVEDGRLDASTYPPSRKLVERYRSDPERDATLRSGPLDRTWYLTMNLTQRPFDDRHVRQAINFVLDKQSMREAWGGAIAGDVATHVLPPNVTGGHPDGAEYDPYPSRRFGGDVVAAREQMRQSGYDTDHDGRCDASACKRILMINRNYGPWTKMQPVVEEGLRSIGITMRVRQSADPYTPIMTVSGNVPFALAPGWGKDYPDAYTFFPHLFGSGNIRCTGNTNYSLVGATPKTRRECRAKGRFRNLPNVDRRINRCRALPYGDDRTGCWIDLDKHIMENVVPWVPYLWQRAVRLVGPAVMKYEFDQFSGELAYAHMAVDESGRTR